MGIQLNKTTRESLRESNAILEDSLSLTHNDTLYYALSMDKLFLWRPLVGKREQKRNTNNVRHGRGSLV